MSFATPSALLALLALPAVVAWYAIRRRERRRAAEAFVAPRMVPSVTPHRPGRRREVPLALLVLALLALILASARPRVTRTVAVERLTTMLAIDVSGSMLATDVSPNRVSAAQRAADVFVLGMPSRVGVGVMQFNQAPTVLALPTRDHGAALDALGRLHVGGGTAIGDAIVEALGILHGSADPPARATGAAGASGESGRSGAAIVLLSDGKATSGSSPIAAAREAARLRIPIFTVALGTATGTIAIPRRAGVGEAVVHVPPDPQALGEIAHASGGRSYTAADAGRLSEIYRQLGAQLGHRRETLDLTYYLIGAGLLLLVLGSAASLAWFGRLI
ncbi:MAG TPA: VWA domain-containing protein [Solirubrobacteraceae bacterium]|jgi:Ca-activated chloride channel family protein|nr:VWA domain-containing protein [Solirubrobacteraceae bacterium]